MRHVALALTTLVVFSLTQPLPGQEKMTRLFRTSASSPVNGQGPLFYTTKENKAEILIVDDDRAYLINTDTRSVRRVISDIPKTSEDFEVREIKTEALKDTISLIQHLPGTPKFAGGMIWLGWSILFKEGEKVRGYTIWLFEQEDP
jgi:hypothetical protein